MPRDKQPNQPNPERDLLDKLFGTSDEMADEDLDMIFEALAPGTDPAAIIHRLAEEAAVEYRTQNRLPQIGRASCRERLLISVVAG